MVWELGGGSLSRQRWRTGRRAMEKEHCLQASGPWGWRDTAPRGWPDTQVFRQKGLFLPCKARRHTCPTSPLLGLSTQPACPSSSPAPSQQASWRTRSPSRA